MPAILVLPLVTGRAIFWNSGKSTWTFSDCASNPAKRSVIAISLWPQALQVLQPLIQAQIFHPVDTDLDAQEGAELFIHAAHQVLAVDPHHVMAMIQLFQHAVQFAAQAF